MAELFEIRTFGTKRGAEDAPDNWGNISIIEGQQDLPFEIKRVYYIYGANDVQRGGHRHKSTTQVLICMSGKYEIYINNGLNEETITLDSPSQGLKVNPEDWHTMKDLEPNSILLVLASEHYDANDYIDEPYPTSKNHD